MSEEKKKIKIRLSPKIPAGAGFVDFISKTDIYPKKPGQVFEVEETVFIRQKLATGEMILVSDDSNKNQAPAPAANPGGGKGKKD